jgi:hypothetical protein
MWPADLPAAAALLRQVPQGTAVGCRGESRVLVALQCPAPDYALTPCSCLCVGRSLRSRRCRSFSWPLRCHIVLHKSSDEALTSFMSSCLFKGLVTSRWYLSQCGLPTCNCHTHWQGGYRVSATRATCSKAALNHRRRRRTYLKQATLHTPGRSSPTGMPQALLATPPTMYTRHYTHTLPV